jgi:hypothetical protein
MTKFRRSLAIAGAVGASAIGAAFATAPAAFACTHNLNWTYGTGSWTAPTGAGGSAPNTYFAINHSDCDYISVNPTYTDEFEAFVTSNGGGSWHGGGVKTTGSGFTKLYSGLSSWSDFYVDDVGRDYNPNDTVIAQ